MSTKKQDNLEKPIQIIVFAEDGVIQAVQSNMPKKDINVTVVDWDDYSSDYDEDGESLREIKRTLAKIRRKHKMKSVW